jgi:hypothetical protein
VQALEREVEDRASEMNAIRQRAGDWRAMTDAYEGPATVAGGFLAVARYILGEDAPKAERCPEPACGTDGGEHSLACPRAVPDTAPSTAVDEDSCGCEFGGPECQHCAARRNTLEPSTAEAFATVRREMAAEMAEPNACQHALDALSLLERRMGAMARAARAALPFVDTSRRRVSIRDDLAVALTAAPPVFTMEEVGRVLSEARDAAEGDVCLSTWCTDEVVPRLSALRK